jgi:hypothetical protein
MRPLALLLRGSNKSGDSNVEPSYEDNFQGSLPPLHSNRDLRMCRLEKFDCLDDGRDAG